MLRHSHSRISLHMGQSAAAKRFHLIFEFPICRALRTTFCPSRVGNNCVRMLLQSTFCLCTLIDICTFDLGNGNCVACRKSSSCKMKLSAVIVVAKTVIYGRTWTLSPNFGACMPQNRNDNRRASNVFQNTHRAAHSVPVYLNARERETERETNNFIFRPHLVVCRYKQLKHEAFRRCRHAQKSH